MSQDPSAVEPRLLPLLPGAGYVWMRQVQLSTSLLKQVALPWLNVYWPQGLEAKAQNVHPGSPCPALLCHTIDNGSEQVEGADGQHWGWTEWVPTVTLLYW